MCQGVRLAFHDAVARDRCLCQEGEVVWLFIVENLLAKRAAPEHRVQLVSKLSMLAM